MIDKVPARICATAAHGTWDGDVGNSSLQRASGPNDCVMGTHQNFDGTNTGNKESSDSDDVPTDSTRVTFESTLEQERRAHAQGQAAVGATLESYDSREDIFATSSGGESGRPSVRVQRADVPLTLTPGLKYTSFMCR